MYIYTYIYPTITYTLQAFSGSIMTDACTQTEHIQLQDAEIQKSWEKDFAKKYGKKRSTCAYCSWHGKAWRRDAETGAEMPMAAASEASGRYQRECVAIATDTATSGGLQGDRNSTAEDTVAFTRVLRSEDTGPTHSAAFGRYEQERDPKLTTA